MEADVLTKREKQVVELIAWGAEQKIIADRLNISQNTVDKHVVNAKEKLHLQKATELSAWYFCTTFHISFDLSPLKRQIIAVVLLLILLPSQFSLNATVRRFPARRIATARPLIRRTKNESNNNIYEY